MAGVTNSAGVTESAGVTGTAGVTPAAGGHLATTPRQFTFVDKINQTVSATVTSDPVTIEGINTTVPITVSGDAGAKYSINGGSFVSTPGTISNLDVVRAQVTASASNLTTTNATVSIGYVTDTFSVTTEAA